VKSFISKPDIFIAVGLSLLGTGLFIWFSVGVSLSVLGAIFLSLGILANR